MDDRGSEALREAEIAAYDVLGRAPGRDLQALVDLAAQVCEVPTAAVTIVTAGRQHQMAAAGAEPSDVPVEESLCAAVMGEPEPVVIADVGADPRFRDNPVVDGRRARLRFYASAPLVTPRGTPIGRLCVVDTEPRELTPRQVEALAMLADRVVDILELRRRGRELEGSLAELVRTQDELSRSNRRLSLFAGQVSHDLRTPLTAILLNTEAALGEASVASDPAARSLLGSALDAGRRMAVLIDELLAFAQVGASLRAEDVDLSAVMAAVAEDLAPVVRDRDGRLHVGALPTVCGDEQALYSVLLNLVSNGLKFARPGVPPRVRVGAVRLDAGWRVEVADNGRGTSAEEHARLFLPFERGRGDEPGNGIGLATAKRVVEAHGGRIGLRAGEDDGTVAWFELPD